MTKIKRISEIIIGLLQSLVGLSLIIFPIDGLNIVAALLSFSLTLRGLRTLVYYFSMARMMVGGKRMLFVGLIYLDLGLITSSLIQSSQVYIMLYLFVLHLVAGGVDIMRGREAKQIGSPIWKRHMIYGINSFIIAIALLVGVVVFKSVAIVTIIYGIGLIYAAFGRIGTAFRKTAIIYIQ